MGEDARRARVLVVDDEPLVARAVSRVLAAHEVVTLSSAREALARITGGETFDVVVCDLMMPDLTGMDLHEALERERPEVAARMLFLTGGVFTERAREFIGRIAPRVFDKPLDPAALRAAVAAVVDAGRAAREP